MRDYNFRIIMEMKRKGEYVQFWGRPDILPPRHLLRKLVKCHNSLALRHYLSNLLSPFSQWIISGLTALSTHKDLLLCEPLPVD